MPFGPVPRTDTVPLRNREPATAPATFTSVIDETLHIVAGTALDMSDWRATAVPAGSRGRVTISGAQMLEAGVAVRFNICTMQPEPTFTPIPADRAVVDAGVQFLARQGYNAIRVMGPEHWVMSGMDGEAVFDANRLDALDYFMAACKREGLYWILCVQSYGLYLDQDGSFSRFNYQELNGLGPYSCKPRMYVEQDIRDNWKLGTGRMYNRINPYTGLNILQDPATLLFEFYNESDTTFCATKAWPPAWLTRYTANAAAKTFPEWLADSSQSHGYANLAALNTSWGSAHASFAVAAAAAGAPLTNALPNAQSSIDLMHYAQYLENDLTAWYSGVMTEWGYTGLRSQHTFYSQTFAAKNHQLCANDDLANFHGYACLAYGVTPGVATTDADLPIWEQERLPLATPAGAGTKPGWWGEIGVHSYGRWRPTFAMHAAAAAAQGVCGLSFFTQGDFFYPEYYNDPTTHGARFRMMDNFPSNGAYVNDFMRVLYNAVFLRGDVAELSASQSIVANDRYAGFNPRNTGRQARQYSTLLQPMQFLTALVKARLMWTTDTTDDTWAATWNTKSWRELLADLQTAGSIAADHPSLVSATANSGSIASVATTGTVGGLAATQAEPVLDIGSHTLADGDLIHVTNMTGSVGSWPGTNLRGQRISVLKGTGNYVQCKADVPRNAPGFALTGLSGVNFTSGTWCEGANVLESGHREWGMSRRLKRAFISTTKTVFFGHTNATLPVTLGQVIVSALSQNASVFVISLDGNSIATSSRLLLGLCGEAINTGMTYTVDANGKQTLTATGDYPVQQLDATATLSLGVTLPQAWTLYRLQRNGQRSSAESPASVDASAARLVVTLRTGTIYPAVLWELEKA